MLTKVSHGPVLAALLVGSLPLGFRTGRGPAPIFS